MQGELSSASPVLNNNHNKGKFGMVLIAMGIVYGDIGTSPMYVMKSVLEGNGGIDTVNPDFVLGVFSLVIWTITLLTTIQFVMIAMKADNKGEGGIFALYSLVRKYGKWLIFVAMLGGATMLADGVLTPAVTVMNAIDGLRSIERVNIALGDSQWPVVMIVLAILTALFLVQRAGTSKIGKTFGPVMLVWFLFLGVTGAAHLAGDLSVLRAINPMYAVRVLFSQDNHMGYMILGSIFLSTTGAEALYSDMGHVGRESIYLSWPIVKICLLLNYGGQCAWILRHTTDAGLIGMEVNPFFQMLSPSLRGFAVLLSTVASIIASQALITGSFTLVSEAINLDLLPHMHILYPSDIKGQLYIPLVNHILWIGCSLVVLYFRSSSRIENAYGLAITVSMLMTTLLIVVYLVKEKHRPVEGALVGIIFGSLEFFFFYASLGKFVIGGYVAVLLSLLILLVMIIWNAGTNIERRERIFVRIEDYLDNIDQLRHDDTIPLKADNIVFFTGNGDPETIDRDIVYSILDKDIKRAQAYWIIHIETSDDPFVHTYKVENYGTDFVFFVTITLGFKVNQRVNVYLRQIVQDMIKTGELPDQDNKYSIYGPSPIGTFRFCFIRNTLSASDGVPAKDYYLLNMKYMIRRTIGDHIKWYGLENSQLIIEFVPLYYGKQNIVKLDRVYGDDSDDDIKNEPPEQETSSVKQNTTSLLSKMP